MKNYILDPEMIENKVVNLFKENDIDICVDGKAIIDEIKTRIYETGGELIEIDFYINNKKYIVNFELDVKYREVEEDQFEMNVELLDMWM